MRRLIQPGPAPPERVVARAGKVEAVDFALAPGQSLNAALTGPLVMAGFRSGAVVFEGAVLAPFRYYLPGPSADGAHAAWFAGPHEAAFARVETANATFGWRDGAPYVHCHAVWIEPDGTRRGGHIIPEDSEVRDAGAARAWALRDVRVGAAYDAESNFILFAPESGPEAAGLIVVRIRPNEDLCTAIEALCRARGITTAVIRGSLGSLVGARFTDGSDVADHATEVLIRRGVVREVGGAPHAEIALIVADMRGRVHEGVPVRGENAVCITFELFLEPTPPGKSSA
ncbi:MAG: PCC domain-containing protein [Acetobacteraceae bacterium]